MLVGKHLAGKTVYSTYGEIVFNEEGISNSLTDEQQQYLGERVGDIQYKGEDKPKEVVKPKEEKSKEEEPKVKKAPTKKATTKKATAKKETKESK